MVLALLTRFDEAGLEVSMTQWPVGDPEFLRDVYDLAHRLVVGEGGGQGHVLVEFSDKRPKRLITHGTQGNWGNAKLAAHLAGMS